MKLVGWHYLPELGGRAHFFVTGMSGYSTDYGSLCGQGQGSVFPIYDWNEVDRGRSRPRSARWQAAQSGRPRCARCVALAGGLALTDRAELQTRLALANAALAGLGTFIPDIGECFRPRDCGFIHGEFRHVPVCEAARRALEPASER